MFLQGTAKAAMKTLVKRVNASTPEKQTGDVRIGAILEYVTVSHLGDQGLGGEIFSVHEFMQDKRAEMAPTRMRSMYFMRKGGEFYPLSHGERVGRLFRYEEAIHSSEAGIELKPEVQEKLASIAEAWLPTINAERK